MDKKADVEMIKVVFAVLIAAVLLIIAYMIFGNYIKGFFSNEVKTFDSGKISPKEIPAEILDNVKKHESKINLVLANIQEDQLHSKVSKNLIIALVSYTSAGNQRFISPSLIKTTKWKDVFKDFKGIFECDPTDEKQDTQAVMATYDTALKFIIGLQGRKLTPVEEYLFNGLISQTGYLSPVEISSLNASTPPSQLPIEPAQSVEQPVRSVAGQQLQTAIK